MSPGAVGRRGTAIARVASLRNQCDASLCTERNTIGSLLRVTRTQDRCAATRVFAPEIRQILCQQVRIGKNNVLRQRFEYLLNYRIQVGPPKL